ncbi:MAG: YgiQ family radical SAM protein [Bacteroidales bacterium]|nr:YgiQ family radical SAM protein [Bacteroidales bacterium]
MQTYKQEDWLPITMKEVEARGWEELDVIIVTGDAYVDHPAFGAAVIGRILEREGLRIAILPQPNWRDDLRDFKKFGKPRLFFGVTAGNMDSMVNHYTANKRLRSTDAYTPDNKAGFRPDYASIVYSKILKQIYPDTPIVLGGIETSLRRVTHYDYWSDQLKPSVLFETGADMLLYGMAEKAIVEVARLLDKGASFENLRTTPQSAIIIGNEDKIPKNKNWHDLELYSHDECLKDKKKYAANFRHIEQESNHVNSKRLFQKIEDKLLIINPPYPVMSEKEMDESFDLPFTRMPHPKYNKRGAIPAYEMIRHSLNMHRGCFGGCSFCTISAHQGKFVASRSEKSILKEVDAIKNMPDFKGHISDLGGPSANMYKMKGKHEAICEKCSRPSCIFPDICKNLDTDHKPMIDIYKKVRRTEGIKKVTIGSGVRYDMLVGRKKEETEKNHYDEYLKELITYHVSGRLKVAPEHSSDDVLKLMRKPSFDLFYDLKKKFDKINEEEGMNQQLIPYFISSHPGSRLSSMADLAIKTKDLGFQLEQVQDFTPTPMTVATVIYHSGYHPYSIEPVYTPVSQEDKKEQRQLFFWYKPEYRNWIRQSLKKAGIENLATRLLDSDRKDRKEKDFKKSPDKQDNFKKRPYKKTYNSGKKRRG